MFDLTQDMKHDHVHLHGNKGIVPVAQGDTIMTVLSHAIQEWESQII